MIGIYKVDILLKGSQKVIFEINGPQHYAFQNDDQTFNDKNQVKLMNLALMGYKVINISYKEWHGTKGVTKKMQLVEERLNEIRK